MSVTPLIPSLLPDVAALERTVFKHPWSEAALTLLCGETAFGYAALEAGVVAAYGGMLTVLDEGQITNIATLPDYRRRGFAAEVLTALLAGARSRRLAFVTLEVRESNAPAIALYEKFGFAVVGRRKNFYTEPVEAALVMQCNLD